ncbi:MAG: BatA domain-containing protein [Polaribacter sp.]|nr:BatA domain-containing protein [Polaribacter sp.]
MQFRYPEILYFLGLLILPILVHLFQLQKFEKTVFTNVTFLQKIVRETRKSSQLKKWLILTTRMLLFTALIIAFSQPYFSGEKGKNKQSLFIYLDNSLSSTAKGKKGDLLQNTIKELIENSSEELRYHLLTNANFYKNIDADELKNILLKLQSVATTRSLKNVFLQISSLKQGETKTLNDVILISDFQYFIKNNTIDFTNVTLPISFVQLHSAQKNNLSIEQVFTTQQNNSNFTIHVLIKNQGAAKKYVPMALFNNNSLVTKHVFSIEENETKSLLFPIQNQQKFNGKITLDIDDTFAFDNVFYFAVNSPTKINVLSIGNSSDFLAKIYSKNEFNFKSTSLKNINYSSLQKQELLLLNELKSIPPTLASYLEKQVLSGGSISIIPAKETNIQSYNSFLKRVTNGQITEKRNDSLKITNIHFKNPFFKNVFTKSIQNFQYPFVKTRYNNNFKRSDAIVSFENQHDFISQLSNKKGTIYWISSPLHTSNTNFTRSPLVVPVFYNFGKRSIQSQQLQYTVGIENTIAISTNIGHNEILSIKNGTSSFIPQQQVYPNRVQLKTLEQPKNPGLYTVNNKENTLETLAFNYNNQESLLQFLDIKSLTKAHKNLTFSSSIQEVLQKNHKKNKLTWLCKWFLTLAIVSLCFEIMILKFFKP